jgi:hypothetical protein
MLFPFSFLKTGGFDPDAQAYIDRVYTAGGTLTNTEANAVNQLTIDMKAANVWTAMKAVYPMIGSSAAACAQNLVSSSFTGTFSSGWTFASTGVTPNGTSAFMNTTFNPTTSLTYNSGYFSFYSRTNNTTGIDDISATSGGDNPNMRLIINLGGTLYCDFNSSGVRVSAANANSLGFYQSSRTSSTSIKVFKNNTTLGTNTNTNISIGQPNFPLYIGASDFGGTTANNFSNRECAFASIGDGLTDTQASNFYTAVQTFQTTLSRAIAP